MILDKMGVRLHYEVYGNRNSNICPVLLLHGWGCSIQHFKPIIEKLQEDRFVIALDFPAHGESTEPPEPWDVEKFAEMTVCLMRELGYRAYDIIAHSFGGRVAIRIASRNARYVNRMVLTGCAGIKKEQTAEQRQRTEAYKRKKKWVERLAKLPCMHNAARKMSDKLRSRYGSADYNALSESMRKTFVKIVNEDLRPELKNIKASVLLVFGEKDTETPLWMGQIMEKEIQDAGLVVFEGDDHFAYLRQWPRFVQIVRAFLV